MFLTGESPRTIVRVMGLEQLSDSDQIRKICDQTIDANPDAVSLLLVVLFPSLVFHFSLVWLYGSYKSYSHCTPNSIFVQLRDFLAKQSAARQARLLQFFTRAAQRAHNDTLARDLLERLMREALEARRKRS